MLPDDNVTYNAKASIDLANAILEENKRLEEFKGEYIHVCFIKKNNTYTHVSVTRSDIRRPGQ